MSEPYLILHKVRGEPAFDIAEKVECPHCQGFEGGPLGPCDMCDDAGTFWIIPTSGHRAHPYQSWYLSELFWSPTESDPKIPFTDAAEALLHKLDGWPDHYPSRAAPSISIQSVINALAAPSEPVERRF